MSLERNFLDIYEVILENDLENFHSGDVAQFLEIGSGAVGRTIYFASNNYDIPINIIRESPGDPSEFIVEDTPSYDEIERLLDTSEEQDENVQDIVRREALEELDRQEYTDSELNTALREIASEYLTQFGKRIEVVGKVKQDLLDENIIEGGTIEGWTFYGDE